jgi:NADPH:quinone reductase-like Zn-dependent oxidoreductase
METMMALRAHVRGGPDQLVYEAAPRPVPGPGEALVEVHAAAITFTELGWDETWTTPDGRDRTPVIPSHEASGIVVALGDGAPDVANGDEVYGLVRFNRDGAAAEYMALPAGDLARRPMSVTHVEAAALPLAALTAWQALVDHAALVPGEQVLVRGAGGVGVYVVQLASHLGAHVTAIARQRDAALLRTVGAQRVIDYTAEGVAETPPRADIMIDAVTGATPASYYSLLREGGRLVTLSVPPSQELAHRYGITATHFIVAAQREQLAHLAKLVDDGHLTPMVAQTFPLSEGRRAYEHGPDARRPGKTVLVVR